MLIALFSLNLWMWRRNIIQMSTSSLQLFPLFLYTSPVFLQRRTFHRLFSTPFQNFCIFVWLRVTFIYEKLSCWNCLWIEAALILKWLNTSLIFSFFCCTELLKWLLRNGVAATLFTEGVLPYQCVCCHWLHCLSGQNNTISKKKREILNSHCKKVSGIKCVVMLHTDNISKNVQNALVN